MVFEVSILVRRLILLNLLFLHISDIHFTSSIDYPSDKIKKILKTIPQDTDHDLIAVVISGDLADSAQATEYKQAEQMINELKRGLRESCSDVRILFVPGNHDIVIPKKSREGKDRVSLEEAYYSEIEQMDDFFAFASNFGLFQNEYSHHVEECVIDDSFRIKFVLLNSAPYSAREKIDKERHYLPDNAIAAAQKDDQVDCCVVIMHHGPQWFEDESKRRIEQKLYDNCDILFIGHEHDMGFEKYSNENGRRLSIIRGGEFNASSFHESTFSLISLDTAKMIMAEKSFTWERQKSQYVGEIGFEERLTLKNPEQVFPNAEFSGSLMECSSELGTSLSDYFVFPTLELGLQTEKETLQPIESEDDFFNLLHVYPCINIIGTKNAGKTALLRTLYSTSIERGYSPIFLGKNDQGTSLKFLISDLVRRQYGDSDSAKSAFEQVLKRKKIIFIDDFDLQDRGKSTDEVFIRNLLESIGNVVFTSTQEIDTNILEGVKREIKREDAIAIYKIRDFYKTKRDTLVEKVCKYKNTSEIDTEEIISVIDESVHNHRKLFSLHPNFVIEATLYYLNSSASARSSAAPFSKIFEANLWQRLVKARKRFAYGRTREGGVEEALVLLAEIAYFLHKHKKEAISSNELEVLMKKYDAEFALDIKVGSLVTFIKEANIMSSGAASMDLRFNSETIHAYFVAKKIESMKETNRKIFDEDIEDLLKNVCFSINENIILFLSYFFDSYSFAEKILEYADEILSSYDMVSFDSGDNKLLSGGSSINVKMIEEKARDQTREAISEQERVSSEGDKDEVLGYKGIYEYDAKDRLTEENCRICALKYLEMAGKSLIIHHARIPREQKEHIAQKLYELPNRILGAILSEAEKDVEGFFSELEQNGFDDGNLKKQIMDILFKLSLAVCLGVYNRCAFSCSNEQTLDLLCAQDQQETTYRVQRLLMIENACDTERFADAAIKQIDTANKSHNIREVICIRLIANKHMYQHPTIKRDVRQRMRDKIFGRGSTADILQMQNKALNRT